MTMAIVTYGLGSGGYDQNFNILTVCSQHSK